MFQNRLFLSALMDFECPAKVGERTGRGDTYLIPSSCFSLQSHCLAINIENAKPVERDFNTSDLLGVPNILTEGHVEDCAGNRDRSSVAFDKTRQGQVRI